jgi:hypothetical protein
VPEVQNAVRSGAQETRAAYYVGFALHQGIEKQRIIRGIVFQISILDNHEISRGLLNSAALRRSLAHVPRLKKNLNLRMLTLQLGENFARSVTRSIVHTNGLEFERDCQDAFHYLLQRGAFVVNGHDDR